MQTAVANAATLAGVEATGSRLLCQPGPQSRWKRVRQRAIEIWKFQKSTKACTTTGRASGLAERFSEPPASPCCGIESPERPTHGIHTEEARLHADVVLPPPGSTACLDAGSTPTTWKMYGSRRGHCIYHPVA